MHSLSVINRLNRKDPSVTGDYLALTTTDNGPVTVESVRDVLRIAASGIEGFDAGEAWATAAALADILIRCCRDGLIDESNLQIDDRGGEADDNGA